MKHCISLTMNGVRYTLGTESEDSKQFWIFEITKAKDQIEKRKSMFLLSYLYFY